MKWTDAQIGVLRAMYPTRDTTEVANLLGRTRRACMLKACQLGISKTREGKRTWTAHVQLPSTWGFGKDEAVSALADLSAVDPSDLLGTEVLTRLYRVAKVFADARLARLQEAADLEVHRKLERLDEYADRKLMELD